MELHPLKVLRKLQNKGITHLYHANTVKTSITFLRQGGLLSRGAVENYGLLQTSQSSDSLDRQFNVWNDIFLDSCDLHTLFNRQNHYGPVLFKFNINILRTDLPQLWITRTNPIYWDKHSTLSDRYFKSVDEFNKEYSNGSYRQMLTLRNTLVPLSFHTYLEEIILDNPKLKVNGISLYNSAFTALNDALNENDYLYDSVKITNRHCFNCWCQSNYVNQFSIDQLRKFFLA